MFIYYWFSFPYSIERIHYWSHLGLKISLGRNFNYKFNLSRIWIIIFSISSLVSFSQLLFKKFECFIKFFKFTGTRCSWSTPSVFTGSVFSFPYSLLIFAICAFFFFLINLLRGLLRKTQECINEKYQELMTNAALNIKVHFFLFILNRLTGIEIVIIE